ncbi:MAG: hypothetical protein V3T53_12815 [Phycisphaerales bacterium]
MPCQYEVTAIIQAPECPPFGFPPTIGTAISEPIDGGLPNVVGYYPSCAIGPDTAFLWIGNENKFITLDMPEGTQRSWAFGISADGTQIVGTAEIGGVGSRAFFIDGDDLIVIPPANGGTFSNARAVSLDRVVGTTSVSNRPPFYSKAYLWQKGRMTIIEPTYGPKSAGRDISDSGAVVGWMGSSGSDWHGLLWDGAMVTDLGVIPNGFTSQAMAINNLLEPQVVGWGQLPNPKGEGDATHAFLWDSGEMMDLGTLPGFLRSFAFDINDRSTAVGFCRDFGGNINIQHAFVWREGIMTDLNDLIPPDAGLFIKRAEAINQAGQITGRGTDDSGDVVAFVLTPIEPPLGDLSGDCEVGAADLLILLTSWGRCDDCGKCPADLNGDCVVGAADLLILLANWSS